jgi:hypothetical protein
MRAAVVAAQKATGETLVTILVVYQFMGKSRMAHASTMPTFLLEACLNKYPRQPAPNTN